MVQGPSSVTNNWRFIRVISKTDSFPERANNSTRMVFCSMRDYSVMDSITGKEPYFVETVQNTFPGNGFLENHMVRFNFIFQIMAFSNMKVG